MNKVPKLSLRDKILQANSHDELITLWEDVARARGNTMTDKTFKRCLKALARRARAPELGEPTPAIRAVLESAFLL